MAAPSILGLYGFFGATLMVGSHLAGWWGTGSTSDLFVVMPFALFFGGLAQFRAGMWSYRARDALATAVHGTWGSFWIAYGALHLLYAAGVLTPAAPGTPQPGHAFWFVVLAAITAVAAIASLGISVGLFGVLSTLATASLLVAIGLWAPAPVLETNRRMGVRDLCGDRLVRRQRDAAATGDGPYRGADRRVGEGGQRPGAVPAYPMEYRAGMPGSKVGQ